MSLCDSIIIYHFINLMFLIYVLIKKKKSLANLLVLNNLSVLEIISLTELITYPPSLLFVDRVACCKLYLYLDTLYIYIYIWN